MWMKWSPVALVGLALIAFSSVWGHQVIAEHIAASSYNGARTQLGADLRLAHRDGLFPSELQRFSARMVAIDSRVPPHDKTPWSGDATGFYNREGARLSRLDQRLEHLIRNVTLAASRHVHWLLWNYGQLVAQGQGLGMQVQHEKALLQTDRLNLSRSSTAGQYRALAGTAAPQVQTLAGLVHARQSDIGSIMSQARHSSHPVEAVRARIHATVASATAQLNQLSLFAKTSQLRRWLARTAAWALGRTWLRYAAQGAADVDAVVAAIHNRVSHSMPAKWVLVSTEGEWIEWFQGPTMIGQSLATTGNPSLPTVKGHFTIFAKFSPFTFVSEDPPGSPDWYPPSPVSYAMEFQNQGYFIHDAPWRSAFGPGTNGPGQPGTNYGGTHGCVNVPLNVAAELFAWAPIGTPVVVV